jgi:hypothetical protein
MKRLLKTLMITTFGLGSLFIPAPASAQSQSAVAEIPFSFSISGKTMPAGKYNISPLTASAGLFTVRTDKSAAMVELGAHVKGNPAHPSVTFARVAGEWVLVKITPPDSPTAYSLVHDPVVHNAHLRMAALVSIELK